jgi:cyclohexanecarboxylate-CoA ligase/acyl-CoA synthetase
VSFEAPGSQDQLIVASRYGEQECARFRSEDWWLAGCAADLSDHWAENRGDERFVSDGVFELSYAEVRWRAYRLGAKLLQLGVRPGDRVAVQLPNWCEFAVSYRALARIGAVMVPIMMVYRASEIHHVLQNSEAVAVITAGSFRGFDHAQMFRGLQKECRSLKNLAVVRTEPAQGEIGFDEACTSTVDGSMPTPDALGPRPEPDHGPVQWPRTGRVGVPHDPRRRHGQQLPLQVK